MSRKAGDPDLMLAEFTSRLLRLRAVSSFIEGQDKFDDDLVGLIRKFQISSLLAKQNTICIAGSQGAGKTTFLRNFYGIGKEWLEDNSGRGEKVPVMIIEKEDIDKPQGAIQVMVRDGSSVRIDEREVSPDEFKETLKGWGENAMMPKLYVPSKIFNSSDVSLLLLPGYEVSSEDNMYWQDIMRHALVGSASYILVVDSAILAEGSQDVILNDMKKNYLEGVKPVIVISKTEQLDEGEKDELKATARTKFEVKEAEVDRVVCVGTGEDKELALWRDQVIHALSNYSIVSRDSRKRKLNYLDNLLTRETQNLLGRIKVEFINTRGESSEAERVVEDLLETFDKQVTSLRRKYRQQVMTQLEEYSNKAFEKGKKRYMDEEEGIKNAFRKIARFVNTTSGEREDMFLKRIEDSWEDCGSSKNGKGFSGTYLEILKSLSSSELGMLGVTPDSNSEGIKALGYGLDVDDGSNGVEITPKNISADVQNCIDVLYHENSQISSELSQDERKELQKAIKVIPGLALEYMRISQIALSDSVLSISKSGQNHLTLFSMLEEADSSLQKFSKTQSNIIKSIAAVLAIDVAADGKIDTIPALFHAVKNLVSPGEVVQVAGEGVVAGSASVTGGAAAVAASATSGIAVAAVGAIVVAIIAYSITSQIQQHDAESRSFIQEAMGAISDKHLVKYTHIYDDIMANVREILENRLFIRYRVGESLGKRDAVMKALADVESLKGDLLEAIRGDSVMV